MATETTPVKKQVKPRYNGGGFDEHPEHINMEGRPDAGWTWKDLYKQIALEKKGGLERRYIVADATWKKAEEGDIAAQKEIADRMDGKPQQKIDATSNGETLTGLTVTLIGPKH